ncbi:MAG: hypothetical protein ACOX5G_01170 [Kiritimatiellia bacterium]|jgi:hypothetical protein
MKKVTVIGMDLGDKSQHKAIGLFESGEEPGNPSRPCAPRLRTPSVSSI